jgi:TDG/mug DNA glycosylase family protein
MTELEKYRPTPDEVRAAAGKTVADILAPDLKVLFCGINPGLYSGAVGHHFARPGNRFWPVLQVSGFTPRLLSPYEERKLLDYGLGITNVVRRATAGADDLSIAEMVAGGEILQKKIVQYRPRVCAVLGVGAYRVAFGQRKAHIGRQAIHIGETVLWVLPNPSGLNAHYPLSELARLFGELRQAVETDGWKEDA